VNAIRSAFIKLLRLIVVVIVVTFLTFWLTKLAPGDPVSKVKPFAPPAERARITEDLGLNDSFFSQYTTWLGNFTTGDFGTLYDSGTPVRDVVNERLPVSLELMIYAQLLSLIIAIPLGVYTAYKAGSRFDGITNTVMFALLALPTFVLALLLQIYVGAKWDLLPTQSTVTGSFPLNPVDNWQLMLMPTVALAAGQIAVYMRLLRSDMIQTLQEDFITTAKAKGIGCYAGQFAKNRRLEVRKMLSKRSAFTLFAAVLAFAGCSHSDTQKMKEDARAVQEKAGEAADATKQAAGDAADATQKAASDAADKTKAASSDAMDKAKAASADAMDATKKAGADAADTTKKAYDATAAKTKEVANDVASQTKKAADATKDFAKETADKTAKATKKAVDKSKEAVKDASDKVKD